MRILIYGFGPYRQFQDNVTEKIIRRLPRRSRRKKIVFPVRFHKGQFLNAIKQHRPDEKARPILAGGPPSLRTNLKLALGRQGKSSNKAGEYVCNYSMYVILDFIKRHRFPIRFGFIHIPHRYDYRKAIRLVEKAIGKM